VIRKLSVGGVFANLKLPQPDKPTYSTVYVFNQQSIELVFHCFIQAINNARFKSPLNGGKSVGAQALNDRYPR